MPGPGLLADGRGPEDASLKEERRLSRQNLQRAFESIFQRYADGDHPFKGKDDVWDIRTNKIVERQSRSDHATSDDDRRWEIGDFGLPGAMGQDDEEEEDNDDDSDNSDDANSDAGIEALDIPRGLSRAASRRRANTGEPQNEDQGHISSEDDMGQWTPASAVAVAYKQARRVKAELKEDLADFLQREARLNNSAPSSSDAPVTPLTLPRRAGTVKLESVAPLSHAAAYSAPARYERYRSRDPAFVKEESVLVDVKPQLSEAKGRKIAPTSYGGLHEDGFMLVPGMNTVLADRAVNSDIESADELSLVCSPVKVPGRVKREEIKEEEEVATRLQTPAPAQEAKAATRHEGRSTPRMTPVVEVFQKIRCHSVQSHSSQKQVSPTKLPAVKPPTSVSPSKRRLPSPIRSFSPSLDAAPVASAFTNVQSSAGSPSKRLRGHPPPQRNVFALPSPTSASPEVEELPLARRIPAPGQRRSYRPVSPPTSHGSNDAYYFAEGSPVASTSNVSQQRQAKDLVRQSPASKPFSPPTPPSSFCGPTTARADTRNDKDDDVFKVPSPPRQRTKSPVKQPSPARRRGIPAREPDGAALKSSISTWDDLQQTEMHHRRRLGSVIREVAAKAPDDDEDDPLGI